MIIFPISSGDTYPYVVTQYYGKTERGGHGYHGFDDIDYWPGGYDDDGGWYYLERFTELFKKQVKTDEKDLLPYVVLLYNGRIAVRCRKEDSSRVRSVFKQLQPERKMYDTRIMMFSGKNPKDHGYVTSSFAEISDAINEMQKNGYESVLDISTTLTPSNRVRINSLQFTHFLSDYEGLIASFSSILDPVTSVMQTGTSLGLELQEVREGLTLDMWVDRAFSNSMDTSSVRGHLVEKPSFMNELFKPRFKLSLGSVCTSTFSAGGKQHVIMVQVK